MRRLGIWLVAAALLASAFVFVSPEKAYATPEAASDGALIYQGSTVYLLSQGQRRAFPTIEVFRSHGYDFSQMFRASDEEVALPEGPMMTFADGTLVRGLDSTVYVVSLGRRHGFTSAQVFYELGYSFTNLITDYGDTLVALPLGNNISSSVEPHIHGTLVSDNGAIYRMVSGIGGPSGRQGVPSMVVFNSYGWKLSQVVPANAADLRVTDYGAVLPRTFPPRVLAVSPSSGPLGTLITLRGRHFSTTLPNHIVISPVNQPALPASSWQSMDVYTSDPTTLQFRADNSNFQPGLYHIVVSVNYTNLTLSSNRGWFTQTSGSVGPSMTITFPNGGERLTIGQTYDIVWKNFYVSSNVDISINRRSLGSGGTSWVARNVPNTGRYTWDTSKPLIVFPGNFPVLTQADDYTIGVATTDGAVWDGSDSTFVFVNSGTAANTLTVFLDSASPPDQTVVPGQIGVELFRARLRATGVNVTIDQVYVGTDPQAIGNTLSVVKIYNGTTLVGSGSVTNGLIQVNPFTVPAGTTGIPLVFKGDFSSVAQSTSFRFGLTGLSFNPGIPNGSTSGTPLYGSRIIMNAGGPVVTASISDSEQSREIYQGEFGGAIKINLYNASAEDVQLRTLNFSVDSAQGLADSRISLDGTDIASIVPGTAGNINFANLDGGAHRIMSGRSAVLKLQLRTVGRDVAPMPNAYTVRFNSGTIKGLGTLQQSAIQGNMPFVNTVQVRFVVQLPALSVQVLTPNGGESWEVGSIYRITWRKSGNFPSNITQQINLIKNPNTSARKTYWIAYMNDEFYAWQVPVFLYSTDGQRLDSLVGSDYAIQVQIRDANNNILASDESDSRFSIIPGGSNVLHVESLPLPTPSVYPAGSKKQPVMRYKITNLTDRGVNVQSLGTWFSGTAHYTDLSRVYWYDGNVGVWLGDSAVTSFGGGSDIGGIASIGSAPGASLFYLVNNASKDIMVYADVADRAVAGRTAVFNVQPYHIGFDASLDSTKVTGSFPLQSNTLTIGASAGPVLSVEKDSVQPSTANPNQFADILRVKLTAGGEDVKLRTLYLVPGMLVNDTTASLGAPGAYKVRLQLANQELATVDVSRSGTPVDFQNLDLSPVRIAARTTETLIIQYYCPSGCPGNPSSVSADISGMTALGTTSLRVQDLSSALPISNKVKLTAPQQLPDFYARNASLADAGGAATLYADICNKGAAWNRTLLLTEVTVNGASDQYRLAGPAQTIAGGACTNQAFALSDSMRRSLKSYNDVTVIVDRGNFDVVESDEFNNVYTASVFYGGAAANSVRVLTPAAPGERWLIGSIQTIRWSDGNSGGQVYTVFLTRADGGAYGILGTAYGATELWWRVGELGSGSAGAGSDYYIQVVKQYTGGGAGTWDQSDYGFAIVN